MKERNVMNGPWSGTLDMEHKSCFFQRQIREESEHCEMGFTKMGRKQSWLLMCNDCHKNVSIYSELAVRWLINLNQRFKEYHLLDKKSKVGEKPALHRYQTAWFLYPAGETKFYLGIHIRRIHFEGLQNYKERRREPLSYSSPEEKKKPSFWALCWILVKNHPAMLEESLWWRNFELKTLICKAEFWFW